MIACLLLVSGFALAADDPGLRQHEYIAGESLSYFFEDTEATYDARIHDGVVEPADLKRVEELQIKLTISLKGNGGLLRRVQKFDSGSYRGAAPASLSTTTPRPLTELIPKFPADFSYEYQSDSQAISVAAKAYAPYMSDPVGSFVYYKALDIHTIQSVIDNIPSTLGPGQILQRPAGDITLPAGIFHNASPSILYQRIVPCGAVRCAVFKAVTMGNRFLLKQPDGGSTVMYTNYQYTFLVPLEGPLAGLLWKGDLQETVTRPPDLVIQRQLSMELTRHSKSSMRF